VYSQLHPSHEIQAIIHIYMNVYTYGTYSPVTPDYPALHSTTDFTTDTTMSTSANIVGKVTMSLFSVS
jgi:hypothetical protein